MSTSLQTGLYPLRSSSAVINLAGPPCSIARPARVTQCPRASWETLERKDDCTPARSRQLKKTRRRSIGSWRPIADRLSLVAQRGGRRAIGDSRSGSALLSRFSDHRVSSRDAARGNPVPRRIPVRRRHSGAGGPLCPAERLPCAVRTDSGQRLLYASRLPLLGQATCGFRRVTRYPPVALPPCGARSSALRSSL